MGHYSGGNWEIPGREFPPHLGFAMESKRLALFRRQYPGHFGHCAELQLTGLAGSSCPGILEASGSVPGFLDIELSPGVSGLGGAHRPLP
jgi:hypothetical protein